MFYLVSEDGLYSFSLGTQDSAKWATGDPPTISYDTGERHVTVELNCSDGGTSDLEALGEDPPTYYKLRLTSKCACWNGCTGDVNFRKKTCFPLIISIADTPPSTTPGGDDHGSGKGLSGGAIFFILLAVFFVVYFVGFGVFYRFRLQRSGVDLIAHRTFWVALPGYAKDGVVHVYRAVVHRGDTPYQSV